MRSSLAVTSLNGSNRPLGRKPVTKRCSSPKLKGQPMSAAWITVNKPSVATSRVSGDALWSGRMTRICVSTPTTAEAATPRMTANVVDTPLSRASTYAYAPTAAMAPCAKFRTPEPRYTSTMPCAESA